MWIKIIATFLLIFVLGFCFMGYIFAIPGDGDAEGSLRTIQIAMPIIAGITVIGYAFILWEF